jgi:hypothetical protein
MSNVLIGIIGVILFIGLALAGALILGDDFKSANTSSKAATIVSMLQQTANAATMYQTRRGVTLMASEGSSVVATLVAAKSLKSVPINPVNPGNGPIGADVDGGQSASRPLRMFFIDLGTSDVARETCREIERSSGAADADAVIDNLTAFAPRANANARPGCMWDSSYYNRYVAYIMV